MINLLTKPTSYLNQLKNTIDYNNRISLCKYFERVGQTILLNIFELNGLFYYDSWQFGRFIKFYSLNVTNYKNSICFYIFLTTSIHKYDNNL